MDPLLHKINPPSLVYYNDLEEYRRHYIEKYVKGNIITFDRLRVRFAIDRFNHAFYKASIPNLSHKDLFDQDRAERIDWIEYALVSGYAEVYIKSTDHKRRLHILLDTYIVVLNIQGKKRDRAFFITAYVADSEAHVNKLKTNRCIYRPK
ncbi:hypothetical protein GF406_14440 [candidate division KSB1 bacterium]|nr:hypothetical protein [candidate division KSB1 bacterium]